MIRRASETNSIPFYKPEKNAIDNIIDVLHSGRCADLFLGPLRGWSVRRFRHVLRMVLHSPRRRRYLTGREPKSKAGLFWTRRT